MFFQMEIESKLKVCRFIGELVKFNMFPKSECLFCLKQLLFDFSHHHIDMTCTFMEVCGRFLYYSPDSHRKTKIYLEQMMRKKVAISMDSRFDLNPAPVATSNYYIKALSFLSPW